MRILLIVQGPGAGREVTAAGVFADLLGWRRTWARVCSCAWARKQPPNYTETVTESHGTAVPSSRT